MLVFVTVVFVAIALLVVCADSPLRHRVQRGVLRAPAHRFGFVSFCPKPPPRQTKPEWGTRVLLGAIFSS